MPEKDANVLGQPEKNPMQEAALANRLIGRGETLNDELIATAETPQELFRGLRAIEEKLENGNIPGSLTESYRPPGQLSIMFNRAETLKISNKMLEQRGWVTRYNPDTGEGLPSSRKYSSLALGVEEQFVVDDKGDLVSNVFGEPSVKYVFKFGTEEKRAEMARAYERAVTELEARAILGEWVGVMLNLNVRDSLEELVNWEHGTTAKFKADHLNTLFNMPDIEEMATNPENHTLGDQVEEAIFLNLVMLNSGTKQRMLDFLARPGADHLISKLHKEEEARRGAPYSRDQWIKDNIGNVQSWVSDYDPSVDVVNDTDAYKKTRDLEKTWRVEQRGKLTKWGNIPAFGGKPGDFCGKDEIDFIEEYVGGLVGSKEASWIAATLLRSIGTYASNGYDALPNGKSLLPLGEARYISSDDRGKFFAYMFHWKEGTKGRPHGLRGMLGKFPDMAFDLFDWAQVAVDGLPPDKDGFPQRRSIWDAWLGTPGGKNKINLLTGRPSNNLTSREEYHRLGSLKFETLDRDFHGSFGIMQWLIGRAEDGVFTNAINVEKFGLESFSLHSLKKINKYIGITMNQVILTKGSRQLYDEVELSTKRIQRNFLRNLMLARIHSSHFSMNILNSSVKMYNPDAKDNEVLTPVIISANIEKILNSRPTDERGLLNNYIDENIQLRKLGTNGTGGISVDVSALIDQKFEPKKGDGTIDEQEKPYTIYSGIVRGRKY